MQPARTKIRVTIEVVAVFLLAVVVFHTLRGSASSRWETELLSAQGLLILEYGAVLGIAVGLMAVSGRDWRHYGITLQQGRRQVRVTAVGFLPVLALSGVLGLVDWHTWGGAAIVAAVALGALLIIAWALKNEDAKTGAVLLLGGVAVAAWQAEISQVVIKTLYFYLLVAPAEEVLFRGYIQSRLNDGFGKPYRFCGLNWGIGLVGASALFGLWHVAWRPLQAGAWPHAMWTCFAGLIFGYVRERSGGVAAGSALHGVLNYFPFVGLVGM